VQEVVGADKKRKERKEKTAPFGVNSMRSQEMYKYQIYRAAQEVLITIPLG